MTETVLSRRLRRDEGFVPCPAFEGDELFRNGLFVFNVTAILAAIRSDTANFRSVELETAGMDLAGNLIDEDHLDSVDITQPLILAEMAPGCYNLIDGNHRLAKARRWGVPTLQVFRLDIPWHLKFLTSREAYFAFVEYWNGKWKNLEGTPTERAP